MEKRILDNAVRRIAALPKGNTLIVRAYKGFEDDIRKKVHNVRVMKRSDFYYLKLM